MTIKTLKPLWAVAYRGKKANLVFASSTFQTRKQARRVAGEYNVGEPNPGKLPLYYVARFVHMHEMRADFTR